MYNDIEALMADKGITSFSELSVIATRREIQRALREGLVVQHHRNGSPLPGLYFRPDAADDVMFDEALVTALYSGVICQQYAAMKHGLTTSLPNVIDVYVEHHRHFLERPPYKLHKTRNASVMTVGVDTIATDLGINVRMTSPQRTIVDLIRQFKINPDGWRHGLDACRSYLDDNGNPDTLLELANEFEDWLPEVLLAAIHGITNQVTRDGP